MEIIIYAYSVLCVIFIISWLFIPKIKLNTEFDLGEIQISVLIPFKNEGENLEKLIESIESQKLDKSLFEVIFINDNSSDNSVEIIEKYLEKSSLTLKLIHLGENEGSTSPKKTAISNAIKISKGKYIATTDADCLLPENWLNYILTTFIQTNAKFISGPVSFNSISKKPIWSSFQQIEFCSLIGAGAASIQLKRPTMCSGANIAYTKDAFEKVKGFEGNENIASGDDEFLLHKIAEKYPNNIVYLKEKLAIVKTKPAKNIAEFYNQRIRWASKWNHYQSFIPTLTAIFIFAVNALFIYYFFQKNYFLIAIKIIPEFIYLLILQLFFNQKQNILLILPLQIIYPFYISIIGLRSIFKPKYFWKSRNYK